MKASPMKLRPHISETVWGGERLIHGYGIDPRGHANAAEAWVLSGHPRGASTVETGPFAGWTLARLFAERPGLFGSRCTDKPAFPVIVKLIDAREDLSVQVHPRDGDPALLPGEAGKTECWYILEAPPGAKLHLGLREAVTPARFAAAIADGTVMDLVASIDVKPGDFYFIPAGTLHAIGAGVLLAEVQQNSDTTYRVFDYNRLQNGKPRELHVEQALAVTDLRPYAPPPQPQGLLCACEWFTVKTCGAFSGAAGADSFVHLLILEAKEGAKLNEMPAAKGDSVFIPANAGKFELTGDVKVLVTAL